MPIMSDDQENQSDEISVLQSIFNDEEFRVEKKETYSGQLYAFVFVKEKFLVVYKNLMNSEDELESIEVDHLPPICLHFDLPKDYPSNSPPDYKLSCPWLSVKRMAFLSVKLEELWNQNIGNPILYIWIDFLKNEALGQLDIVNYLDVCGIFTKDLRNKSRQTCKDRGGRAPRDKNNVFWEERTRCWNERRKLKSSKYLHNRNISSLQKKSSDNSCQNSDCKSALDKTEADCNNSNRDIISLNVGDVTENSGNVERDTLPDSLALDQPSPLNPQERRPTFLQALKEKFGIEASKPKFQDSIKYKVIMQHMPRVERKTNNNIIALLVGYNEDRTVIEFKKGYFTCDICFQCQIGSKCTQFKPCNHVYCSDCIHSYFSVRVSENTVKNMPCPHDKCDSEASQHQIKEVLGEELYSRYDRLLLSATLDTMTDVVYCPRKGCQLPVLVESDRMAYCPSCSFAFCALCLRTYHGVQPCAMKNEERRKLAMTYHEASSAERTQMEARYGKQQLISLLQNVLSTDWISEHSKGCPCCKTSIEKSDGCNKMVCTKCNTIFCWLCHTVLNREEPYKHFYDLKSKCYNQLFLGLAVIGDDDDDEDDVFYFGGEEIDENDEDIFIIYGGDHYDDFYFDDGDDDDDDDEGYII